MRPFPLALPILLLSCLFAGCGGGGGGGNGQPTPTPSPSPTATPTPLPTVTPRLVIGWGERSRATGGLNSAVSATVRLAGAKPDGSDLVFTVNRAATPGAYEASVLASEQARQGQWGLIVTFFADANAAGAVVGVGQANVTLGPDGVLPDISITATVKQVEVATGQRALVGAKSDVTATARGDSGAIVPVSPGSIVFRVTDGATRLHFVSGQAEGLLPGDATVVAQIDGVTSAPASMHVGSNAVVTVNPNPAHVSINGALPFSAQVSTTSNQAVTWMIQEGSNAGTIDASGNYTAPATPGVYHIIATSQYDPEKSATVAVTVEAGNVQVGGDFPPTGGVGVSIN